MNTSSHSRERRIRESVHRLIVQGETTKTAVAEAASLSRQTLHNFLEGETSPQSTTLDKLDDLLERLGEGEGGAPERTMGERAYSADPDGSPAEQLIYYYSRPHLLRRFAGTPTELDGVKAAYETALDMDLPREEMEKLDAWREDVRQRVRESDEED